MFDMGFIKDLRYILRQLPNFDRRQSMLFSATLSFDVMELAYVFMNDAIRVSVTPEQVTAENVEHLVYHVGKHEKIPLLLGLLRREGDGRVLVFVNMRRSADRLAKYLELNGFAAAAITGDVDQRQRLRILADFKEGRLPILVATDVASRGLHIDGVTHVINYDLPLDAEDYVHRIGRTARAGASGKAIQPRLRGIRRRTGADRGIHRLQAALRDRRGVAARTPGASPAARASRTPSRRPRPPARAGRATAAPRTPAPGGRESPGGREAPGRHLPRGRSTARRRCPPQAAAAPRRRSTPAPPS